VLRTISSCMLALSMFGCGAGGPSLVDDPGSSSAGSTGSPDGRGAGSGPGDSSACAEVAVRYQEALDDAHSGVGSPGAVAAVRTPECATWVGAAGTSTVDDPMAPSYGLRVGSVTKTFVAALVLQLASEGTLELDDPIGKWVASVPNGDEITLRNLLNHSSGLFDIADDAALMAACLANPARVWTPQALLDAVAARPPLFAPGTGWSYSNTNYILLGMAAEAAGGAPLHVQLRARLLEAVGIEHTFLDGAEQVGIALAHGYSAAGQDVTTWVNPSCTWAAGAMVSTAGDLADWAVALHEGSVLDAAAMAEMLDFIDTTVPGLQQGLGVFSYDPEMLGAPAYGHPGAVIGYMTRMLYLPEHGASVVVILNRFGTDPAAVAVPLIEVVLDR